MLLNRLFGQMKRKPASSRRRKRRTVPDATAAVEVLEDRALLAGNVLARMDGGDLVLTGDSAGNAVSVTSIGGGVQVLGIGTRVNGLPLPAVFPGVSLADLTVNLRGGNDTLVVASPVGGSLKAKLGGGSDVVNITSAISGSLNLNVGSSVSGSADVVTMTGSSVGGSAKIKGTAGRQEVFVEATDFGGAALVTLGGGNDLLNVSASTFATTLKANGGGGLDTFINVGPAANHRRFEMFT